MTRFFPTISLATMLLVALPATPAFADPADPIEAQTSETTAPAVAVEPKSPKKVCKGVATTGSIMIAKKVCKTKEQWAAMEEEIQADMRRQKRSSASRGSSVD